MPARSRRERSVVVALARRKIAWIAGSETPALCIMDADRCRMQWKLKQRPPCPLAHPAHKRLTAGERLPVLLADHVTLRAVVLSVLSPSCRASVMGAFMQWSPPALPLPLPASQAHPARRQGLHHQRSSCAVSYPEPLGSEPNDEFILRRSGGWRAGAGCCAAPCPFCAPERSGRLLRHNRAVAQLARSRLHSIVHTCTS